MKGYKLCKEYSPFVYVSYAISDPRYRFSYTIGKATKRPPGYGPMAVFETLKDLEHFVIKDADNSGTKVAFECNYTKSRTHRLYDPCIKTCWVELPAGTDFANSVTLIKEVKRWKRSSGSF